MSTNSSIRIKRKDGTRAGIYCHWNGYIEGVGVTLQLAYNTADKIEKLIALGDLDSLRYYPELDPEKPHSFDGEHQENVCVAYHRDRGEAFTQTYCEEEFIYTFDEDDGVWYVEYERATRDTDGQSVLSLHTFFGYEKKLLLDAIFDADFSRWCDDELATKDNIIDKCIEKAMEPRKEIIRKEQEEYDAYYHAYCD